MDDVLARQRIRAGDLRFTGLAPVQRPALVEQFTARRAVDGAIHSPAAEQALVRGIHDGLHIGHLRNVSQPHLYFCLPKLHTVPLL